MAQYRMYPTLYLKLTEEEVTAIVADWRRRLDRGEEVPVKFWSDVAIEVWLVMQAEAAVEEAVKLWKEE